MTDKIWSLVVAGKKEKYFATGKIVLCRFAEDGKYNISVSVNDCVSSNFKITTPKPTDKEKTIKVKSDIFSDLLLVPECCKVTLNFEEEKK